MKRIEDVKWLPSAETLGPGRVPPAKDIADENVPEDRV